MQSGERRVLKIATIVAVAAALLLFPLTVLYGQSLAGSAAALGGALGEAVDDLTVLPADGEVTEAATFLIYGIDAGEWVGGSYRPGPGRADTIVLIKFYPALKKAAVLSIPRDTLVEIPGRPGDDKVNHAYAFGQAELLVKTVERFTGVAVDHYVGLNYRAFKDIVDLLGGVEFEVDREIRSRGRVLTPGLQLLDGDAAFALVSDRQEPLGDIGRVRRQQRFLKAVVGEARTRPPDELFLIALAAWHSIETNIDLAEALRLNRALRGLREEDMVMEIVPGWFYNRGGISYWRPYPEDTAAVVERLFVRFEAERGVNGSGEP